MTASSARSASSASSRRAVAFDIWSDGSRNEAWLMADGTLYSVDLATGKATEAAKISGVTGKVTDIAIMGM